MDSNLSQSLLSFALDIYKQAQPLSSSGDGNIFCSPFSITAALGMTLAGARGNTAKEISTALHVKDDAAFHKSLSRLQDSFKGLVPDIALHVANRIYCEKTFDPLESYCAFLQKTYATTIESVDFRGNPEAVRLQINSWVEEVTRTKIKDLLPEDTVTAMTVVILINAVYFKGLWHDQFNPKCTRPMDFHKTLAAVTSVDMMYRKGTFKIGYSSQLRATALEMPYKGGKTSMIILLPDEIEGLKSLEQELTPLNFSSVLEGMSSEDDVEVYLPKFKVEQSMDLKKVLHHLGVKEVFTRAADLSGISKGDEFMFSDAIHKAFVEVNEEGTEAAAATAMMMMRCCMMQPENRVFKADHPFMFFIAAHEPSVVLFVGSLKHP